MQKAPFRWLFWKFFAIQIIWFILHWKSSITGKWIKFFAIYKNHPMDTSSSIRHWSDVKIPRGKFVEITSVLKGESTWKLWHRFDMNILTWIRLSKSMKYRWVLHVDFSMSFQSQIDVTFHFLTFSALGTYSKLFWYNAESL